MKINDFSIQMMGVSTYSKTQNTIESLTVWGDSQHLPNREPSRRVVAELTAEGKRLAKGAQGVSSPDDGFIEISEEDKEKIRLLAQLVYMMTGKKIRIVIPKVRRNPDASQQATDNQTADRVGWGISYSFTQAVIEEEHMSYKAQGVVRTMDGREINLNLSLNMGRSFASFINVSFQAGDALVDPLVINLGASAASLGEKDFEFDLNADGIVDRISFVNEGSGFLVYDKNENGIVDDGTELFGPSTGNGFSELEAHDEDGNGWIDENDAIYSKLSVWIREDGGNPRLLALGQTGVGAIYLGHLDTQFTLVDDAWNTQGKIQKTGVFLFENGSAGTIQHVDLTI